MVRNVLVVRTVLPPAPAAVAVTVYRCAVCSAQVLCQVARWPLAAVLSRPLTGTWRWPAVTWTLRIGPLAEVTVMAAVVLTCLLPLAGVISGPAAARAAALGPAEPWPAPAGWPPLPVHAVSSSPAAASSTNQRPRRWAESPISRTMAPRVTRCRGFRASRRTSRSRCPGCSPGHPPGPAPSGPRTACQSPEQAKRPLTLAEAGFSPAILYGGIVPLWPAGETAPGAG